MKQIIPSLFATVLIAISQVSGAAESFYISCHGSPPEAKLETPAPAKAWVKVGCTRFGQVLMAADNGYWTQTQSPRPVMLPADMLNSHQMREVGNNAYFKEIKIRLLEKAEALKKHELFYKWLEKERVTIYPEVWELSATNESGKSLTINFYKSASAGGWGIACVPECGRMKPFLFEPAQK